MSEPEQLSVVANGLTFGALAWGDAGAPLALLVHGYPDTAWTWRHVGPRLAARGWRVVAPFSRGYAPTDIASRYLISDLADDVLALRDALGGDERSVVVGHDWGAAAVWKLAETRGSFASFAALSLPPTHALLLPLTRLRTLRLGLRQTAMSWYFVFDQLPGSAGAQDRLIPRLWRWWAPSYDAREDVALALEALSTPERKRAAVTYYRDNLRGGLLKTFATRPTAPVLYIHGDDDGGISPDLATAFPDVLPAGTRHARLPGVGHFPQLEAPDRVDELLASWLTPA